MMKNRKSGFTLVELIVVITLVATLSIYAGVSISKIIKKNNEKTYQASYDKIYEAIHMCSKMTACNSDVLGVSDNSNLNGLISAGVLDGSIINEIDGMTGNEFDGDTPVSLSGNIASIKGCNETLNFDWKNQRCN